MNVSRNPEHILSDRMIKAHRMYMAVKTNCKVLGISNIRIKIQLINALVTSVLLYGCIVYACLGNVETTLTPTNAAFSKVEIFARKMLRWAFSIEFDTRKVYYMWFPTRPRFKS